MPHYPILHFRYLITHNSTPYPKNRSRRSPFSTMSMFMVESAASPSVRESKPDIPLSRSSVGPQDRGQHVESDMGFKSLGAISDRKEVCRRAARSSLPCCPPSCLGRDRGLRDLLRQFAHFVNRIPPPMPPAKVALECSSRTI